jgi:hypothetical protein
MGYVFLAPTGCMSLAVRRPRTCGPRRLQRQALNEVSAPRRAAALASGATVPQMLFLCVHSLPLDACMRVPLLALHVVDLGLGPGLCLAGTARLRELWRGAPSCSHASRQPMSHSWPARRSALAWGPTVGTNTVPSSCPRFPRLLASVAFATLLYAASATATSCKPV